MTNFRELQLAMFHKNTKSTCNIKYKFCTIEGRGNSVLIFLGSNTQKGLKMYIVYIKTHYERGNTKWRYLGIFENFKRTLQVINLIRQQDMQNKCITTYKIYKVVIK